MVSLLFVRKVINYGQREYYGKLIVLPVQHMGIIDMG